MFKKLKEFKMAAIITVKYEKFPYLCYYYT